MVQTIDALWAWAQGVGLVTSLIVLWFATGPLATKWIKTIHNWSQIGLFVVVGIYLYTWLGVAG